MNQPKPLKEEEPVSAAKKKKATAGKKSNPVSKQKINVRYEDLHFIDTTKPVWNYSLFSEKAIEDFKAGQNHSLYHVFGAHQLHIKDTDGFYFSVWAPNAASVFVTGDFNGWNTNSHPLLPGTSGIWEGFIPGFAANSHYKYHIQTSFGLRIDKGDPFARHWQKRPDTASVAYSAKYEWNDTGWMKKRKKNNALNAPWSIYEIHPGSWRRPDANDEESFFNYRELAHQLAEYLVQTGFTHVELMPIMEHPFDGSWGYQCTGYFAPTSRYGTPEDLVYFVDYMHQHDIGVLFDWVPSHFPYDAHGLFMFDGTHLYEYEDMRKGYHPDWKSYIFNYEKGEVRSFLISSARFWFDVFHIDGMRVDAVSSMLYLNYSREEGQWAPNKFGGDGNLEATEFIKELNKSIYLDYPDVQMMAEEATNYQWVAKPIEDGGLGFGMKWMMGWMNDTLKFFSFDPLFRGGNINLFTFSIMYCFKENYLLPFSHDEVVHGKSPMLYKMPGDEWQKFAGLRLLYGYMFTHPGAKLLFMGNEWGQTSEWNYKSALDWHLLQFEPHRKLQQYVAELNRLYKSEPALHENQFSEKGFEWISVGTPENGLFVFLRKGKKKADDLLVVLNIYPVPRHDFEVTVKGKTTWAEILNSDTKEFWGTGDVFNPQINSEIVHKKSKTVKIKLHLPPLGVVILK
jgi:1,4-alpha-glucan branching enzyme